MHNVECKRVKFLIPYKWQYKPSTEAITVAIYVSLQGSQPFNIRSMCLHSPLITTSWWVDWASRTKQDIFSKAPILLQVIYVCEAGPKRKYTHHIFVEFIPLRFMILILTYVLPSTTVKIVTASQARIINKYKNLKNKILKYWSIYILINNVQIWT
jgi:hypothetical protein